MRVVLGVMFLFSSLSSTAWGQGGLMDLGKSVLKQQMQSAGAPASSSNPSSNASLSTGDIASGLREALRTGVQTVVGLLGKKDGFNADPAIHVPLPDSLRKVQSGLKMAGLSASLDDLELRLNRAAESAAPEAERIFLSALDKMTLDDARAVLNGPQDAATQYFKRSMSPDLRAAMRPIAEKTVAQSGAVQSLNAVAASAKGLIPGLDAQSLLTDHVLDYGLSGLFSYLAKEEAAIRSNPAKRTSDILRKVFAN